VGGQRGPFHRADRSAAQPGLDPAVVVEDGHAVGGEPHVALQTGRAQAQAELEALDGVVERVGPAAPVGEGDRRVAQRVDDPATLSSRAGTICP
jgi:hypothetical protein